MITPTPTPLDLSEHLLLQDFFRASKKCFFLSVPAFTPPLLVSGPLKNYFFVASLSSNLKRSNGDPFSAEDCGTVLIFLKLGEVRL